MHRGLRIDQIGLSGTDEYLREGSVALEPMILKKLVVHDRRPAIQR